MQVLTCYFVMLSEKRFLTIVGYGTLKKLQHDQANCHYLFLSAPAYTLLRIKGCVEPRKHVASGNKGEKTPGAFSSSIQPACRRLLWEAFDILAQVLFSFADVCWPEGFGSTMEEGRK